MLTVANLGETTLEDVGLISEQSVLPPGRYTLLDATDGVELGTLLIASGGYLRGEIPLGVLEPLRAYVLRLETSVRQPQAASSHRPHPTRDFIPSDLPTAVPSLLIGS